MFEAVSSCLHPDMACQLKHGAGRHLKLLCYLILSIVVYKVVLYCLKHKKKRIVPLLEQEVNRHFNSANVWISMSLCYSASLSPGQNRHAVISAALSARLYHHNSGANVVLQVFNDTEIIRKDLEVLNLITKSSGGRGHVILAAAGEAGEGEAELCDCALSHSLGRALVHALPQLGDKITEDSIVILSHVGVFLTKAEILNVVQSRHQTWMYGSEPVFYNMGLPWPTVFTAMTARKVTDSARSCSDLVTKQSLAISALYSPPWRRARDRNESSAALTARTNTDIMAAVAAAEKFITQRLLVLHICYVPGFNKVWTAVGAAHGFDPRVNDVARCWKGIGYNSCVNSKGYWHQPGLAGCHYWTESVPRELVREAVPAGDPLWPLLEQETSLLFSSA